MITCLEAIEASEYVVLIVSNVAKQVYNGSSDCIELLLSKILNELGRA